MKLRELPVWEKPREKLLLEGAGGLSNAELLAVLLCTGTREKSAVDLAAEVLSLDKATGLRHLADCSPEELRGIDGMGEAKTCTLLAAVELGKRIASSKKEDGGRITCSSDIALKYMESMRYHRKEHFLCILLDSRGGIIEEAQVSVGDVSSAPAGPREVFASAVRRGASCVVFLHNHPSGDPEPSKEDVDITARLTKAGEILGIRVLDHIIIGDGVYASLKSMGLM